MAELGEVLSNYGPLGLLVLGGMAALVYIVRGTIDSRFRKNEQKLAGIVKQAEVQFGNLHDARFKIIPEMQDALRTASTSVNGMRVRAEDSIEVSDRLRRLSYTSDHWYRLKRIVEANAFLFKREELEPLRNAIAQVDAAIESYRSAINEGAANEQLIGPETSLISTVRHVFDPAKDQIEDLFRVLLGVSAAKPK